MASSSFAFFLVSLFLFLTFVFAKPKNINEEDLNTFYKSILLHENQSNIVFINYPPFPRHTGSLPQLYNKSKVNGVDEDIITRVYPILGEKLKYEAPGVRSPEARNIDLSIFNVTIFHRYNDVKIGNKLPLVFANQGPPSAKLLKKPQRKSKQNPFSNNPTSIDCGSTVPEEKHACVASLEAMMEFAKETIGTNNNNVMPISTPPGKWQLYTVSGEARTIRYKVTACHKTNNLPFAVYGCHHKENSLVRVVPLIGEDGTKIKAFTICHMKTSSWDPNYLLFRLMKAKPGVPVCHFLAADDIVWVKK